MDVSSMLVSRIPIPIRDGLLFIKVDDIIRCEADVNYSILFLLNNKKIITSKTLKQIERLLSNANFARVHKSHLVNLNYARRYVQTDVGYVVMSDDSQIPVSRRQKQILWGKINATDHVHYKQ
jgi:two-component system LytT family response regulator